MWGPGPSEPRSIREENKNLQRRQQRRENLSSNTSSQLKSPWYDMPSESLNRSPQKEARIRRGWRIALTSIFGLIFLVSIANLFFPHTKNNQLSEDVVQIVVFGLLVAVVQWRSILRHVRVDYGAWSTNRKAWTSVLGVVLLLQIVSGASSYRKGASPSIDIVGAVFWLTLIVGVQLIFIWRMSRRLPHRLASTIGNRFCGNCGSSRTGTKFCGNCGGFLGQ